MPIAAGVLYPCVRTAAEPDDCERRDDLQLGLGDCERVAVAPRGCLTHETSVMDDRPIGVFDSGVGGLSVLRAIRTELPAEDTLYVADSGHAPYGDRARAFIEQRAIAHRRVPRSARREGDCRRV